MFYRSYWFSINLIQHNIRQKYNITGELAKNADFPKEDAEATGLFGVALHVGNKLYYRLKHTLINEHTKNNKVTDDRSLSWKLHIKHAGVDCF